MLDTEDADVVFDVGEEDWFFVEVDAFRINFEGETFNLGTVAAPDILEVCISPNELFVNILNEFAYFLH